MTMRSRSARACHDIAVGAVIASAAGPSRGILTCIAARPVVVAIDRGALTGIEARGLNLARIYAAAMAVTSRISAANQTADMARGCNGNNR